MWSTKRMVWHVVTTPMTIMTVANRLKTLNSYTLPTPFSFLRQDLPRQTDSLPVPSPIDTFDMCWETDAISARGRRSGDAQAVLPKSIGSTCVDSDAIIYHWDNVLSMNRSWRSIRKHKSNPDGVTIYPVERLGNQLFIYAAGLSIARRLGVPCYANCGYYRHPWPRRQRGKTYDLGLFDSGVVVPTSDDYHRPIFAAPPLTRLAHLRHNQLNPLFPSRGGPIYMERSFNYDDRILDVGRGSTVLGWFQSWKYFSEIAEEIRWRVFAISKPTQWYLSMKKHIRPGTGSVVLNVRRGDYLTGKNYKHFGIASASYYQRALDLIQRLGLDGPIYVASDSIDVAMKELAGIDHVLPLVPPPDVTPLELLLLMSRSDAIVAANSTFSWWAAFLGEKPEQIVIAPRPWFSSSGIDTRDLLPPNWLTLDREATSNRDRSDPDRQRDSGRLL